MINYVDLALRMGYFQNLVFRLFGGNSECIFPRLILNADSGLHPPFQSSGIHLYLKSCTNRTRMNSRCWEQKVIWWKREHLLSLFRAWDWPQWVLNWIVCSGPPPLLLGTFILPLKWLPWKLLSLWNASCSQITHLLFLLNQKRFTAWIWELTISFSRLDFAISYMCLTSLS